MSDALATLAAGASAQPCRPVPRHLLTQAAWATLPAALAATPDAALIALWADATQAHALLGTELNPAIWLFSVPLAEGTYSALSPARPTATWFERAIADLWGHRAIGTVDARPWLDHGAWPLATPLAARPGPPGPPPEPPGFPLAPGATHQVPLGPVHGAIAIAAHLRLHAAGTKIAAAETRRGYTHKGTLALMRGKPPRAAARFAARLAGEATVAHATAFALAVEAALGIAPPDRAHVLRAVMADLERLAAHLDALGATREAASLAPLAARWARARETIARAAHAAFGHRLMMDAVVPGGIAADLVASGEGAIPRALDLLEDELPDLARPHPGLRARLRGLAVIRRATAGQFAAPDTAGDAEARDAARLAAIAAIIPRLRAALLYVPDGPLVSPVPVGEGEGLASAEATHGAAWHWLRLEGGLIAASFARDPGWALWPLREAALAGAEAGDVPLILASLPTGVSGSDL